MKTKRTIISIVVFLAVFWISILAGFKYSFDNNADKQVSESLPNNADEHVSESLPGSIDNADPQTEYEAKLNSLSIKYGNVASTSNRLYLHDEAEPDLQAEQDTSNIENYHEDIPLNESAESNAPTTDEEAAVRIEAEDMTAMSDISDDIILQEEEPEATPSAYADIGISIADSYVNVRAKATTESEIVGKLYRNSAARILDTVGSWYYVESGSVKGYISTDYIKTGIPDEELIEKYGKLRALINTEGLNVREKPDIEAKKLTVVYQNEVYPVIEILDEWLKVDIADDRIIGYASKEYVELLVDFEKAVSRKEEEELKKLQEEERMKKETQVKYREEVDYTEEELKLLACLVHSEAGDQSYEGKLAVANIVLNRVKSSIYPDTIKDVIYQPGQFSVVKIGSLSKQLDNYESYSTKSQLLTIKAAKAALQGANNIGNRLYFHTYKLAVKKGYNQKKNAVKIEDHLFW